MIELFHALLLLTLRLAVAPHASQAPANIVVADHAESALIEATGKAAERYEARAFEEALPAAEEAVEEAWKEFGADDYRTIAAEEFLAHLAALTKDPARAQAIREETDRKLERLGNPAMIEKIKITRAEEYRETTQDGE